MDTKNNYHKNKVVQNNQEYLTNQINAPTQHVKKTNQFFGSLIFDTPNISFFADASVKKNTIIAGYGISDNTILVSFKKEIFTTNNNLAELIAIHEAIKIAKLMEINQLEIFTDCLPAVEHIKRFSMMQKSSEIFLPTLNQLSEDLGFLHHIEYIG